MKDTAVMKLQAHVIVTVHDFWNRAAIFLRSLLFKIYFIVVVVTTTKIGSTCTFYIIPLEFFFFPCNVIFVHTPKDLNQLYKQNS